MSQKRVLCIQDLSCIGRCSLTVILPSLSAMGLQACPLPTALLSSHPLGFTNVVHRQKTAFCSDVLNSFSTQNIKFDAVLTGYFGAPNQAQMAETAIKQNENALIVVDPVMADHGKLYKRSTKNLCNSIINLCNYADIITPNVTESAVLLGLTPSDDPFSEKELEVRLNLLAQKFKSAKHIIITGTKLKNGNSCNAVISKKENSLTLQFLLYDAITQSYPGTGDLFASIVTGSMLKTGNIESSIKLAANFISNAAKITLEQNGEVKHGVRFEQLLSSLIL